MLVTHAANRQIKWNSLPDDLQVALAEQALQRAAAIIATQAECLAAEMDSGALTDQGGPEALRLLAAVLRAGNPALANTKRH